MNKSTLPCYLALLLSCSFQSALAFYNPTTGRWLSRDRIQEAGGANLYTFVLNHAIGRTDAVGLYTDDLTTDFTGLVNPGPGCKLTGYSGIPRNTCPLMWECGQRTLIDTGKPQRTYIPPSISDIPFWDQFYQGGACIYYVKTRYEDMVIGTYASPGKLNQRYRCDFCQKPIVLQQLLSTDPIGGSSQQVPRVVGSGIQFDLHLVHDLGPEYAGLDFDRAGCQALHDRLGGE